MALEGLGQQQTNFYTNMGEMQMRFHAQEEAFRKAKLQGWMEYMQKQEAIRHAEKEAQRRRNQALGMQAASIGGAAAMGPLMGMFGGAAGAAGKVATGTAASGVGDFFGQAAGGMMYA